MLALFGCQVADGAPDVLLHVGLPVHPLDHKTLGVAADAGLDDLQPPVGLGSLGHERIAELGIGHLGDLLVLGARGDRTPSGRGVVEVPVLQREGEARPPGPALCIDRQFLVPALVDPAKGPAVYLGVLASGRHHVVQDRALGRRCEYLEELDVGPDVAGALGDLDEALVAFGQHACEVQDVLVTHDVSDHGGAVVVGLHAVGAETLDGEAAQAGVHPLVQQPGHFLAFGLGGGHAGLGLLEAHDVGHQRRRGHVLDDVHALRGPIKRVEVLRDGLPVPVHAQPHRLIGDRLGTGHREHRAVTEFRLDRREAETAISEHHRRHPVISRDGAPRIPANLGVVVGVQVDKARGHDLAGSVDDALRGATGTPPELGHLAVLDPDIALVARHPCAVHHRAVLDVDVEIRVRGFGAHGMPPQRSAI